MLEQPNLADQQIIACLQDAYGLPINSIAFLPLGADANTAVYRAVTPDDAAYFVKLRRGAFDNMAVELPSALSELGMEHLIAPLATKTGPLWSTLDGFTVILYPFVAGHNGYERRMSDQQWLDFGRALRQLHTASLAPPLRNQLQQERYGAHWRNSVETFLQQIERDSFHEPIAAELAAFITTRRDEIVALVARTEQLAQALKLRSLPYVVCHADIHAGNVMLDANNALYIVDWDAPILAPKERDLMFIGGALMGSGRTPQEEEALFYRGYGAAERDLMALAYYRYERIIQDIAAFCEEILVTLEGNADRAQSLRYFLAMFQPGSVLEQAYKTTF